jgi:putative SOS response-associated peptidase YedK
VLVARWGLVPSWAKDIKIGSKLINARSESILEKPSFRKAAVKRRAIVPAEGYYEWQKTEDGKKIPNYLYSEKEPLLGFAGLYEWWADPSLPEDDPASGCSAALSHHDDAGRAGARPRPFPGHHPAGPLSRNGWTQTYRQGDVQHLLDSLPEPTLTPRIVSPGSTASATTGPELIEPAELIAADD